MKKMSNMNDVLIISGKKIHFGPLPLKRRQIIQFLWLFLANHFWYKNIIFIIS